MIACLIKQRISFALWVLGVFITPLALGAETIDTFVVLQKRRIQVCKEIANGDEQGIIKALKKTGALLEKQAKKSVDPEFMRRAFTPANRKLELIYQADKIGSIQINYINDVFRAAVAGLRTQYRDEIRNQILVEKNLKSDFFENDCKKLLK
jgi:hypothetical protein